MAEAPVAARGSGPKLVDALLLRAHPDVGVALAEHLVVRLEERRFGIEARTDVEPLDDDRAVELRWVSRPSHVEACLERRDVALLDRPLSITTERTHRPVGRGEARQEELVLGVTLGDELRSPGAELDARALDLAAHDGARRGECHQHHPRDHSSSCDPHATSPLTSICP